MPKKSDFDKLFEKFAKDVEKKGIKMRWRFVAKPGLSVPPEQMQIISNLMALMQNHYVDINFYGE